MHGSKTGKVLTARAGIRKVCCATVLACNIGSQLASGLFAAEGLVQVADQFTDVGHAFSVAAL